MQGSHMRWFAIVAAAAVVGVSATLASAQSVAPPSKVDPSKAEAVAKARDDFMKANSAREKILVSVVKGEAPLDAKAVQAAADQAAAAKDLLSHFPVGSGADVVKGSRAKPEIWTQWDKFAQLAAAVGPATQAVAVAAKAGDLATFKEKEEAATKACAACHKDYRAPRQ